MKRVALLGVVSTLAIGGCGDSEPTQLERETDAALRAMVIRDSYGLLARSDERKSKQLLREAEACIRARDYACSEALVGKANAVNRAIEHAAREMEREKRRINRYKPAAIAAATRERYRERWAE